MVYTNMIENHTHKIFTIVHNTSSFNRSTKLCNLFEYKNNFEISFSRHLFSIVKEMLLEIQRITVDLYKVNDKFLNVISTDKTINEKDMEWNVDNSKHINYKNIIGNIKLMGEIEKDNSLNLLYKNIEQAITVLGKPTSEQIKFVELFYKKNHNLDKKKNSVKWWKHDNMTMFDDLNDKNFSFFNNMGSLILIVNNFNDESCKNVYEVVKNSMLKHKENVIGLSKLKSLRLIMINIINEQTTLFKKYYLYDSASNVYLDRFNIHFDENSKETISSVLREIFNLNSFTMTNIPMKDDSNSKLSANVEMFYPNTFVLFENVKMFDESKETITASKMQYESINLLTNVKSFSHYTTFIAAWSLLQKRSPLLVQSLPYTIADFSSREGTCANEFILGGKNILPELILKNTPRKGIYLAFSLSKNIDQSNGQIGIIDEVLYESKTTNEIGGENLADEKIMKIMSDVIDSCICDIEKTNNPGLEIDDELTKALSIFSNNKSPCVIESNDCFRNELNKIITILSKIVPKESVYPYLKAIIESKEMSKDQIKCFLDVISNFKHTTKNHRELYEDFCYFYFKDHINLVGSKNLKKFKKRINIKPTKKNTIEMFVKCKVDNKPEFAAWANSDNNEKTLISLYQNLNNKSNDEQKSRPPFKSMYVVLDTDEVLLMEYAKYIKPLSDDYLKVAPPPYIGGGVLCRNYEKQMIEYKNYVNLITNKSLPRENRFEIERECDKFRVTYSKLISPIELENLKQFSLRKRRNISDMNLHFKKIPKITDVDTNGAVTLTRKELDMIDKMNENYRKSLKGKIISIDEYDKKLMDLENSKIMKNDKIFELLL